MAVGFMVVNMMDVAYKRFQQAEDELFEYLFYCRSVALQCAVHTGLDEAENAMIWRTMVCSISIVS